MNIQQLPKDMLNFVSPDGSTEKQAAKMYRT